MNTIEIRRNVRLAAIVGAVALVLGLGFALRGGGAVVLALVLLVIAGAMLWTAWDGRAPLVVVDAQGVRLRIGRTWTGLLWHEVDEIEHSPRAAGEWYRDGRLAVLPVDEEARVAALSPMGQRIADLHTRLYGVPFAVPLGLTTRVVGAGENLTAALAELAADGATVVEIDPVYGETAVVESASQLEVDYSAYLDTVDTDHEDTSEIATSRTYISTTSAPENTVPVPVIGLRLAVARTHLGLTHEELSERTRISPGVIRSMEADDFTACGGDFYARGNLRTLARVLGVPVEPLLSAYERRYADAPTGPVSRFASELDVSGAGRRRLGSATLSAPVLAGGALAIIVAWAVGRMVFTDHTAAKPTAAIKLDSTAVTHGKTSLVLTAAGGSAHVSVTDGKGLIVFDGTLAFEQTKRFKVALPVHVQTSDGSVLASVGHGAATPMGATGESASAVYTTAKKPAKTSKK